MDEAINERIEVWKRYWKDLDQEELELDFQELEQWLET